MGQTMQEVKVGDDVGMIKNPDNWPHWPFLPVKRRKTGGVFPVECGVIFEGTGTKKVWKANIFALPSDQTEFFKLPNWEYSSVEELVDDGWVVD